MGGGGALQDAPPRRAGCGGGEGRSAAGAPPLGLPTTVNTHTHMALPQEAMPGAGAGGAMTAAQRRAHWAAAAAGAGGAEGWVCDRCGTRMEDGMCVWETGRRTRADAGGERCVVLCGFCEPVTPHGRFVDA